MTQINKQLISRLCSIYNGFRTATVIIFRSYNVAAFCNCIKQRCKVSHFLIISIYKNNRKRVTYSNLILRLLTVIYFALQNQKLNGPLKLCVVRFTHWLATSQL